MDMKQTIIDEGMYCEECYRFTAKGVNAVAKHDPYRIYVICYCPYCERHQVQVFAHESNVKMYEWDVDDIPGPRLEDGMEFNIDGYRCHYEADEDGGGRLVANGRFVTVMGRYHEFLVTPRGEIKDDYSETVGLVVQSRLLFYHETWIAVGCLAISECIRAEHVRKLLSYEDGEASLIRHWDSGRLEVIGPIEGERLKEPYRVVTTAEFLESICVLDSGVSESTGELCDVGATLLETVASNNSSTAPRPTLSAGGVARLVNEIIDVRGGRYWTDYVNPENPQEPISTIPLADQIHVAHPDDGSLFTK